ncbi:nucleoside 2-deoxyribosyltransferase [Bradyrhizobium canariense]|uniref:nucleoside 2-deoxyribosyltransferase n=1 Tax=Bradyrhizobium canariense TaxID=255045 RepID=UPI001B89ECC3|nr:nucleoside 2-deoxyribosyltransferase [Bradyrhizobium canariense]MBR0951281.1 nucleoside 2-deoxyribosyltransferase [Bradyrhizobium canariense]
MNEDPSSFRVYLAAPLFNDSERSFNLRLAELISPMAEVFLPQRDGKLMRDLVRSGMPLTAARELVFEADINALKHCDCVVAVLDGRTVDEGVAFEIGYARALDKLCLGVKTDDRTLLATGDNPMIVAACNEIFGSVLELVHSLRGRLLSIRKLVG